MMCNLEFSERTGEDKFSKECIALYEKGTIDIFEFQITT